MTLYYLQKAIYEHNRSPDVEARFRADVEGFLSAYDLTKEERRALVSRDIGLLYVLGVNGQLLMHFAAASGFDWNAYIQAMRQGCSLHGPVRAGLYAIAGAVR